MAHVVGITAALVLALETGGLTAITAIVGLILFIATCWYCISGVEKAALCSRGKAVIILILVFESTFDYSALKEQCCKFWP